MRRIAVLVLVLAFSLPAAAQWSKLKFGDVSLEELKMTHYDKDSTAGAVVLYDYGELNVPELKFQRYTRIKVLTKEGYQWGDVVFPIFGGEEINFFSAATYNLQDGKMVTTSITKDKTFKEEFVDGIDVIRWAMPNVREGSVIELKYEISNGGIRDWEFQRRIPTAHSEFLLLERPQIKLQVFMQGYLSPQVTQGGHWLIKDVPAFVDEPYISSYQNYVSKLNIELASIQLSTLNYTSSYAGSRYYQDYNLISEWGDISKQYNRFYSRDGLVNGAGFLSSTAKDVVKNCKSPDEKVKAIHSFVQANMQWNDRYSLGIRQKGLKKIFEEKNGTSGEINWILLAMMRHAGLPADPVLVSTRDNGIIRMEVPNRSGFNNFVIMTDYEGKKKMIDGTNKDLAFGFLPESCLNGLGYWVKENGFQWVELKNEIRIRSVYNLDVELSATGDLHGVATISRNGCSASASRKKLKTSKDKYLKEIFEDADYELAQLKINNLDSPANVLREKYDFTLKAYAQAADNALYINPVFLTRLKQNPFHLETRVYPIDFDYPYETVYTAKIKIPEGYQVEELPKPRMALLPENSGRFIYNATVQNDVITIVNQFALNKSMFAQTEYPDVREFYNIIAGKHAEQIVLKKK